MLNAFRTHSSFCAAPLEVLAQTLLYENYRCFHRGPKFQRRYTEIMRLFPTSRLFLAPCFTRPALISRPYIMSMEVLAAGGAQFLAPRVLARLLFYRCTTRRYCFRCCRSLLDVCNPHRIFIEGARQLPSLLRNANICLPWTV